MAALMVLAGSTLTSSASGSATSSALVPITPCRLLDTRPGSDNVGPRSTPLGPDTTYAATARGTNGKCTIPSDATGLSMNVTIIGPTGSSFLTVFPSDQERPLAASLNWVAGQAPTGNAVTAGLSADGRVSFYNLSGNVDLAVDVVGYYVPSTSGPSGPAGPTGPVGPTGPTGPAGAPAVDPAHVVWVAPSGTNTFPTVSAALASITDNSASNRYVVKIAPGTYTEPNGITMKDYVELEGSGQTATVITSPAGASAGATVFASGSQHGGIRDLTIDSSGGPSVTRYGLRVDTITPAGAFRVSGVTVTATTLGSHGTVYGVHLTASSPTMSDMTVTASGAGPTGWSTIGGAPTITNVTVSATGVGAFGSWSVAMWATNAQPVLRLVTLSASGGNLGSTGFATGGTAAPVLIDVTATASSGGIGSWAYGAEVNSTSTTITDGSFSASGGTAGNFGVLLDSGIVEIVGARIAASGAQARSVYRSGGAARVAGSVLGAATFGSPTCANNVDASFVAYTCA